MKKLVCWVTVIMMLLTCCPMAFAQEAELLLVAETVYGTVSGVAETEDVAIFKGVPYAAPPVGELRWKAPQDPESWEGVLACDEYAPMAMQILSTTDWYGPEFYYEYMDSYPNMSEDCLYLNVATPATSVDDNYPVIVYIHGGANMHGYSYEPEFDPTQLANKGVVVVTIGHRLGLFGYMATPELSEDSDYGSSGNYTLLDLIKGLEWVQENIASFGGDPSRVTIAGQSAGAGSVLNLMVSPMAKGLFHNAFLSTRSINVFGTI
ncbi:MAG: carboxylesterase family protein, partial [Clostridia bacterium]|nr:carboxylesterase family protein [Clostridia bacterium]